MTQTEIHHYVTTCLAQESLISLATADASGVPWASVVEFACDEKFTLYWLSAPNARHSVNIEATNRAAGTVTLPLNEDGKAIGLQIEGTAERVVGEEVEIAQKLRERERGKPIRPDLLATRSFYKLVPDRIYLLHEPLLGYERVSCELVTD